MNRDEQLTALRDLIQVDVGNRGLRRDPQDNLITACSRDFASACHSLASAERPHVKIYTGFFIPYGEPPAGETDGPLGAVFLARVLTPLGFQIVIETYPFCANALEVGLDICGLRKEVPVLANPHFMQPDWDVTTHLIALECCGPNHTEQSLRAQLGPQTNSGEAFRTLYEFSSEVPQEQQDRCYTMRGVKISTEVTGLHWYFEVAKRAKPNILTIGIGDGGNEIGMGKIAWDVIRRNISGGGLIACRVPTDHLVVAGVSNWGAYALAAGVALLRGKPLERELLDVEREREILRVMVEQGPLVDGVTGKPTVTVDGLEFDRYAEPLRQLAAIT